MSDFVISVLAICVTIMVITLFFKTQIINFFEERKKREEEAEREQQEKEKEKKREQEKRKKEKEKKLSLLKDKEFFIKFSNSSDMEKYLISLFVNKGMKIFNLNKKESISFLEDQDFSNLKDNQIFINGIYNDSKEVDVYNNKRIYLGYNLSAIIKGNQILVSNDYKYDVIENILYDIADAVSEQNQN